MKFKVRKLGGTVMPRIFATAVLMLFLGITASVAWSEVERVEMRVDGLACPFCAYGLEKKLKDVPGVSEIEIRVDDGIVILKSKKGESVAVDRLKPAVKDAGFTAREIRATAVGNLATVNDRPVLRGSEPNAELILEENDVLKDLRAEVQGSKQVRLTGRLVQQTPKGHHGHPFTMKVETFEILESGTE
jgi:mercuric ion binding protein